MVIFYFLSGNLAAFRSLLSAQKVMPKLLTKNLPWFCGSGIIKSVEIDC